MVILTLTEKGGEPRQLSFEKTEVTVGRVQGNDIVLPKGNVSKRHCRIYLQDGQFSVEDLKSTNGTYVNGRKITEPTVVSTADKVYVGDFVIRVDNATPADVPTPAPPANEAGALSSALQRRPPPPPPPPLRSTGSVRPLEDEGGSSPGARSSGRISLPPPPPPPPPPRRESRAMAAVPDPVEEPPEPAAAPADIDLDDEPLAASPPRLNVPPLRPVASLDDDQADEVPTATRDRSVLPVAAAPVPADYPGWVRRLLEEGAHAVYVTGAQVEIDRGGRREGAGVDADGDVLVEGLRALAARGTPRPEEDAAVVNTTLPDGSRLAAVFPPVAAQACAAIHRPGGVQKNLGELVTDGALSREMQQVLEACGSTRRNVLVSGDRRAAEIVLQALANTIASRFRVVVIADRLNPPAGNAGWVKLAAQAGTPDLVATAAALRPDYLIADLASAKLAGDVLRECALGQDGTFAAIAGRSAQDALGRLQALAAGALGAGAREILAGTFDVVVHASTLPDGGVRVVEIAEPKLDAEGRLHAEPLLGWRAEDGRGGGAFQATGVPSRLGATLAARGVAVPANVLRR